MDKIKKMTTREATRAGYFPLTYGYALPRQWAMLSEVVADLLRGRIGFVFVQTRNGVEVWRASSWVANYKNRVKACSRK